MSAHSPLWCTPLTPEAAIRPLHREDIPATAAMAGRAFGSEELGEEVAAQLRLYCDSGLDEMWLEEQADGLPREYYTIEAAETGAVLGLAGLYRLGTWTWPKVWWLGWFALDPAAHGRGLGGAALRFVMRLARSRGALYLKVETAAGSNAANFYQRFGFEEEAVLRNHYGFHSHARILVRPLGDVEPLDAGILEEMRS